MEIKDTRTLAFSGVAVAAAAAIAIKILSKKTDEAKESSDSEREAKLAKKFAAKDGITFLFLSAITVNSRPHHK
jgi:hypothetical protein